MLNDETKALCSISSELADINKTLKKIGKTLNTTLDIDVSGISSDSKEEDIDE